MLKIELLKQQHVAHIFQMAKKESTFPSYSLEPKTEQKQNDCVQLNLL